MFMSRVVLTSLVHNVNRVLRGFDGEEDENYDSSETQSTIIQLRCGFSIMLNAYMSRIDSNTQNSLTPTFPEVVDMLHQHQYGSLKQSQIKQKLFVKEVNQKHCLPGHV